MQPGATQTNVWTSGKINPFYGWRVKNISSCVFINGGKREVFTHELRDNVNFWMVLNVIRIFQSNSHHFIHMNSWDQITFARGWISSEENGFLVGVILMCAVMTSEGNEWTQPRGRCSRWVTDTFMEIRRVATKLKGIILKKVLKVESQGFICCCF